MNPHVNYALSAVLGAQFAAEDGGRSKFTQEKALSRESASESGQKFITVRQESKGI